MSKKQAGTLLIQYESMNLTRGYKDGLQPESLADGNWLVKQNQPVSKIETKSDTNLSSLYESWFSNALISKSVILWWQVKKGINSELEGANTRRVLNILSKRSLYLMRSSHTSAHLQKKSTWILHNPTNTGSLLAHDGTTKYRWKRQELTAHIEAALRLVDLL